MTPEEEVKVKSQIRTALIKGLTWGAIVGLGIGGAVEYVVSRMAATPGDTPVVLVGGSLKFKAGSQFATNPTWTGSGQDYYLDQSTLISTIVLKNNASAGSDPDGGPDTDDADSNTDKFRVDVSNFSSPGSWEIDEYTALSDDSPTTAITLGQDPSNGKQAIHVQLKNFADTVALCATNRKLVLGHNSSNCPNPKDFKFNRIVLLINQGGTWQNWASFTCLDSTNVPGTCRIVFKTK